MINHRTDFFVLGIVILELMLGFHPFDPTHVGGSASLVDNLFTGRYVGPAAGADDTLVAFVKKALEPQPFKRHRTVSTLAAALTMDLGAC